MSNIDIKKMKRADSRKITFSFPSDLIKELDIYCKENIIYKSKFVANAVANAIISNPAPVSK